MKFVKLANLFSSLEATSKRLEMTDILAEFFSKLKKEGREQSDLKEIMYLLQGHLVSNIKQFPKMGIAEKMIIEALSILSGISNDKIKNILIKEGDIGKTAEFILKKKKKQKSLSDFGINSQKKPSIEIQDLYSELKKIAQTEGEGSHNTKLGILRGLIEKISPLETKYLLRIITSTLRVGASTQTIIDGLALGFTGSKENRDIIEGAYNVHPDLGDVVMILAQQGIKQVKKIKISYGIPTRMMLASRVPYEDISSKLGEPFVAEYKLDGERLQIHKIGDKIKLFSRRLLEISDQYPDVCESIRKNVQAENVIIEGEVVAMDKLYEKMLPFQVLSKRRRKYDVEEMVKEVPVCLFLFDLLKLEEESYLNRVLPERRAELERIINEEEDLQLVKSAKIHTTNELLEFFEEARDKGNEGIIAKSIQENSVYQAGNRGFLWIKLKGLEGGKLKDTIDVVLVGAFYGKGRRTGVYGTYIGAVYDPDEDVFKAFTRIASGWTDEIMDTLTKKMEDLTLKGKPGNVICNDEPDIWLSPNVVIEIIGDEITKSEKFSSLGFSMRFPVFQRFRPEKHPKDITTVNEIKRLYEIQ
ncbi:MAG: ATP-dependent DNA ligase [Promethearchaeia archaeon]